MQTTNTILVKLEGNNPAGSVKDRPALSMIQRAEERGDIKPGDTLIEATSGNTGIALAMAAAIKGYKMVLIMPETMSAERRASMKAYGAELIIVSKAASMEGARDLALQMDRDGKGKVLNQFANEDNPLCTFSFHWAGNLARYPRAGDAFCQQHGYDGHDHGDGAFPQIQEPGRANRGGATGDANRPDSGDSPLDTGVFAGNFPP